ncbi:unnamed protein product [Victoria cruziana]
MGSRLTHLWVGGLVLHVLDFENSWELLSPLPRISFFLLASIAATPPSSSSSPSHKFGGMHLEGPWNLEGVSSLGYMRLLHHPSIRKGCCRLEQRRKLKDDR